LRQRKQIDRTSSTSPTSGRTKRKASRKGAEAQRIAPDPSLRALRLCVRPCLPDSQWTRLPNCGNANRSLRLVNKPNVQSDESQGLTQRRRGAKKSTGSFFASFAPLRETLSSRFSIDEIAKLRQRKPIAPTRQQAQLPGERIARPHAKAQRRKEKHGILLCELCAFA